MGSDSEILRSRRSGKRNSGNGLVFVKIMSGDCEEGRGLVVCGVFGCGISCSGTEGLGMWLGEWIWGSKNRYSFDHQH